jgi:Wiskott-Aldrich syndrome protein
LLAGIQKAGGIGSLKKVDKSQVRDRSAAAVPGSQSDNGPAGSGMPPASTGGADGGLAGALAAALNQRKKKVSASGKSPMHNILSRTKRFQMTKQMMMIGDLK